MGEGSINFKSTKEVYGVDPKVLANMSYKDATQLKLEYANKKYKEVADKIFQAKHDTPYEELVQLDMELNRLSKAIALCELQLEEIGYGQG